MMWEAHPDFAHSLKESWARAGAANSAADLLVKLKEVSSHVSVWDRDTFGSVQREPQKLNRVLEKRRDDEQRMGPSYEEIKLVEHISELNHREEIMWKQRSRITWLAEGNKNTKFFHLRASVRRRKNKIKQLKREDRQLTEDEGELKLIVSNFYGNLYTSEATVNMEGVLSTVPRKVSDIMNRDLLKEYSGEEVKQALFPMFPTKAPGPDGFLAHSFQRHWELCGEEVTNVVIKMLNGTEDLSAINETPIVLIPKVASPEEISQFRPISLCNVIYKIASKVVANRSKGVLLEIISEEQSTYVPGRSITDNIISAYECLHYVKCRRAKNSRCGALKLDMMKAYDHVEWDYLAAIVTKLGFHQHWVQMVMSLVTSVSFLVLFNGDRLESSRPTRGLHQGDPILPYLFLLTAKGLNGLINSKIQSSELNGIKVASSALTVSHLLFADDSLLFFRAYVADASIIKETLDTYCGASGQRVNMNKSSIFFAKGVDQQSRDEIKLILNVHNESLNEKHLGLPTVVGSTTMDAFKYLKEKM
jgi:hypothetical protein